MAQGSKSNFFYWPICNPPESVFSEGHFFPVAQFQGPFCTPVDASGRGTELISAIFRSLRKFAQFLKFPAIFPRYFFPFAHFPYAWKLKVQGVPTIPQMVHKARRGGQKCFFLHLLAFSPSICEIWGVWPTQGGCPGPPPKVKLFLPALCADNSWIFFLAFLTNFCSKCTQNDIFLPFGWQPKRNYLLAPLGYPLWRQG